VGGSVLAKASIFSFFSGAGFLDLGFEDEGFEVSYVNENHKPFVDAYIHARKNMGYELPKYGCDVKSIEKVDVHSLAHHMRVERAVGNSVGFIGGPPCPDFSVGGKNRGQEGDNGKLSRTYVDLVCELKPDFFLFENVKGLYRTHRHREFFESLKSKLQLFGYRLHERLINALEYGAPQDRDRIILFGFRDHSLSREFSWEGRLHSPDVRREYVWPTTSPFVEQTSSSIPNQIPLELTVQHWFDKNKVIDHPNASHCFQPRAGLARFKQIEEGDDSKKSYKRLHRWRYSPTAAYGNNEVHLHPFQARRISASEALAIQSLPAEFVLPPTMTLSNMFKTIGNGVPYLAARGLAKSVALHLESSNALNCPQSSPCYQPVAA
jgi:DNA (cytosine-5)-methyltransferase 1